MQAIGCSERADGAGTPVEFEARIIAVGVHAKAAEVIGCQDVIEIDIGGQGIRRRTAVAGHVAADRAEVLADDQEPPVAARRLGRGPDLIDVGSAVARQEQARGKDGDAGENPDSLDHDFIRT